MEIDLSSCEIRTPTGDERLPLYRMLTEIFPSDGPLIGELIENGDRFPGWPAYTLCLGDEVLGNVSLAPTQVWLDGRVTELVGIAWVATREEYRRQGVANHLMRHLLGVIDGQGLPSVLFTGLPGVYERLGYEPTEQIYLATTVREVAEFRPKTDGRVYETLTPSVVEMIARIYAEEYPNHDGKIVRDAKYWRLYRALFNGNPSVRMLVAQQQDRAVGYARVEIEEDRVLVSEFCCDETTSEAGESILGSVAELASTAGRKTITLALPSTHLALQILNGSDIDLRPEPAGAARETFMVRAAGKGALGPLEKLQWPLCDKF